METTRLAGRRTIPLQISACRQSSTGLPTIVSRLADNCRQATIPAGNAGYSPGIYDYPPGKTGLDSRDSQIICMFEGKKQ
jgi:hypothetical protein